MRVLVFIFITVIHFVSHAQPVLKTGNAFPSQVIRNIINAPVKQYDVQLQNRKFLILNFWGTWCSPCLPEMDSLSKLQGRNKDAIQVIAVSDEPVGRLKKYLERRPSSVWLASDTTLNLYRQFGFNYVGQSAIINKQNIIIALVRTDSINQVFINRLLQNETVKSSAEVGNRTEVEAGLYNPDSTAGFQVTWGAYRPGLQSMGRTYIKTAFEGRRLTYQNVCLVNIFKEAYGVSNKQVIYEVPEKSVCNWDDKGTLYCLDLLVRPDQKDSLLLILRQTLGFFSPFKVKHEKRSIPVYVLRCSPASPAWKPSINPASAYSYSGKGFTGTAIAMKPFVDYISNELDLPVIDETGLKMKYDINTENVLRSENDIMAALNKLGLTVDKTNRLMDVIVIE